MWTTSLSTANPSVDWMANLGGAHRVQYYFEAYANQHITAPAAFVAKNRCTGVCHLLNLAKDLIRAAHILIKF